MYAEQITTVDENSYLSKVYTHMGLGVLLTAIVSYLGYASNLYALLFETAPWFWVACFVAELVLVGVMSARLYSNSAGLSTILFYLYAAINGFTCSSIFYCYELGTITGAFVFSAVMFLSCSIIGRTTKRDLSKLSTILLGGLIALLIATIASLFIPVLRDSLLLTYIGIVLFLVMTAYDTQKVLALYSRGFDNGSAAIYGALTLYLDFINLFLRVLQVLGRSSSSSRSSK